MLTDPSPYEIMEGPLDPQTLDQLFKDIQQCGEGVRITVKGAAGAYARQTNYTLEEAKALLEHEKIKGLQIRYAFEGLNWCDTLFRSEDGIRLIRAQLPTG